MSIFVTWFLICHDCLNVTQSGNYDNKKEMSSVVWWDTGNLLHWFFHIWGLKYGLILNAYIRVCMLAMWCHTWPFIVVYLLLTAAPDALEDRQQMRDRYPFLNAMVSDTMVSLALWAICYNNNHVPLSAVGTGYHCSSWAHLQKWHIILGGCYLIELEMFSW